MGHRANLWQGLVLPLSFLCPQSPLMPVSWRGASALLLHSALQAIVSASIVATSSPCSPMAHNPAEPWCPSHIRAWKGWPVPTVEWTEGSVQTSLPHRRTLLTHRLPLSHPDLGNDTAPDSKSMMELSNLPFPTPVKTQYRSGTH